VHPVDSQGSPGRTLLYGKVTWSVSSCTGRSVFNVSVRILFVRRTFRACRLDPPPLHAFPCKGRKAATAVQRRYTESANGCRAVFRRWFSTSPARQKRQRVQGMTKNLSFSLIVLFYMHVLPWWNTCCTCCRSTSENQLYPKRQIPGIATVFFPLTGTKACMRTSIGLQLFNEPPKLSCGRAPARPDMEKLGS